MMLSHSIGMFSSRHALISVTFARRLVGRVRCLKEARILLPVLIIILAAVLLSPWSKVVPVMTLLSLLNMRCRSLQVLSRSLHKLSRWRLPMLTVLPRHSCWVLHGPAGSMEAGHAVSRLRKRVDVVEVRVWGLGWSS